MKNAVKLLTAGSAIAMVMTASAFAADIYEPQVIETPVYQVPESVPAAVSGWYIRGDVGYSWSKYRGAIYSTPGSSVGSNNLFGEIDEAFSLGGGIGYQANSYLRTDLTVDYDFDSDFTGVTRGSCGRGANCISTDKSTFSALTVMANAYIDLGTYAGFTPYVGAGIGGANVKWGALKNTACDAANPTNCDPTVTHGGSSSWRFAYALMAGFSYDISHKLALDLGYRYKKIEGGYQFASAGGIGRGYDHGFEQHQVRAGLRYKFGGTSYQDPIPDYQPEPIYK
ncbi:outer membrane protein [Ahrensia sp. 13_GOM-1096m]|uniref:outer membrane protein n=1 Tax=Ahrensia sp. 13_GOM-1096m TaxID=1380380 RepID=UPI00047D2362|nr:outer membrane protein [Ahrensia sp. 13_GOM-1096m]